MIGQCEVTRIKNQVRNRKPYKWNYSMGVEPQPKNPRKIRIPRSSKSDYLTKEEFYEGMEDAEMKGMADDPSAGDIYDEFNR